MRDHNEILDEYRIRQSSRGPLIAHMRRGRDHFNGSIVIPLPEMERDEKSGVANLMAQGLDQTSMRIASVMPGTEFPPMIYGKNNGSGSEDWAHKRRLAVMGWWEASRINLKLRRLARFTVGYGTGHLMVRPNFDKGIPEYVLRDPLSTYPSLAPHYDDDPILDVIYAFQQPFSWLEDRYPEAARTLAAELKRTPDRSSIIELIEYNDAEERVLIALACRPKSNASGLMWAPSTEADWTQASGSVINRIPNRAGVCWGMQNNRISIDQLQGQFDQVFGIYQNQARLMALETIAVEKAIFPDLVIQGTTAGRTPMLINGKWEDGRSGKINMVRDGSVQPIQLNPGFMTQPLMDRHERHIRQAGVPSQFSGEAPTGIATGRMGSQVLSASVDYPIQEYQEGLADLLQESNKRAIAVAKGYFGKEKRVFHVSFNKTKGKSDYTPDTHFETDHHYVRYSAPGSDLNSLVIGLGQRVGLGSMSVYTSMQQDPMINDPEFEYRRVSSERIQMALLASIAQRVEQGAIDPQDVVILWEEVERGSNIADAWTKAQAAAQKRQAEAAEAAQAAQQQPGGEMDPAVQAGLSPQPPPGDPAEAGLAIQGPNPNQQNLSQLLGALRQPNMITAPMAGQNAPNVPVGG